MNVTLSGEIRQVKECKRKDGSMVKTKDGQQVYILRVEQRTDGPTISQDVGTTKNSKKVGDKVDLKVRMYAQATTNGRAVLKAWEV